MDYSKVFIEIIILIIYILIGYILRKIKMVTDDGILDISKIVVNVAMPLLVFKSFTIKYEEQYLTDIKYMALLALGYIIMTTLLSRLIVKKIDASLDEKNTMRYCMIFGNVAFLGFPMCSALFGDIGLFYASIYLAVQNSTVWTVGVNLFTNKKLSFKNLKNLINPGIIAILSGLIVFFFKIEVPEFAMNIISGIGGITVPLALIMIGTSLYGSNIFEIIIHKKTQMISFVKVLIFPALILVFIYFLPVSPILKAVLVIETSAPVQASSSVFAKTYGGDAVIAAKSVFLSTIMSLITIPLFLLLINL